MLRKHGAVLKKHTNRTADRVVAPPGGASGTGDPDDGAPAASNPPPPPGRHRLLDADGLASPGGVVRPGDILLNKQTPANTRDYVPSPGALPDAAYRPAPVAWRGPPGEAAVVDRVLLTRNDDAHLVVKARGGGVGGGWGRGGRGWAGWWAWPA